MKHNTTGITNIKQIKNNYDVYDIETKHHNFFSDGVLVHNSFYMTLKDLIKRIEEKKGKIPIDEKIDFCIKIADKYLLNEIENCYEDLQIYCNSKENKMVMKIEKIASSGLFTSKKKYALKTYYNEGTRYLEPKPSVTGLEIKQSSTPKKVQKYLEEAIDIILTDISKLKNYLKEIKKEYILLEPEDIAKVNSISTYNDYITPDLKMKKKGVPIHIRGSRNYNYYIRNILKYGDELKHGEKVQYLYLKVPNIIQNENVFSWYSGQKIPKEIKKYIDYNLMFEKTILLVLNRILERIHFKQINLDYDIINMNEIF